MWDKTVDIGQELLAEILLENTACHSFSPSLSWPLPHLLQKVLASLSLVKPFPASQETIPLLEEGLGSRHYGYPCFYKWVVSRHSRSLWPQDRSSLPLLSASPSIHSSPYFIILRKVFWCFPSPICQVLVKMTQYFIFWLLCRKYYLFQETLDPF